MYLVYREYHYNQDEIIINRYEDFNGYTYIKMTRIKGILHIVLEHQNQTVIIRNHSKYVLNDDKLYRIRVGLNNTYICFKEIN